MADSLLSPASLFSRRLAAALDLELRVQAYEQSTLGSADLGRMNKYQLQRRARLDHDRDNFVTSMKPFSAAPLKPPVPAADAELSTDAVLLISQIAQAYETSRNTRDVDHYHQLNMQFLDTSDWNKRETAARQRDTLIERERAFASLVKRAKILSLGRGGALFRQELRHDLLTVAPELLDHASGLTLLVLESKDLRKRILADVIAFLGTSPEPVDPISNSAQRLLKERNRLYEALLELSGLMPIFAQWTAVATELSSVSTDLEEIPRTDFETRRETLARKVELLQQQNEIRAEWYSSAPDSRTADQLIDVNDRLIQTSMAQLGMKGSLFFERHATLDRLRTMRAENHIYTWQLLDEQDALLKSIQSAKPAQDYLRGLDPPPPDVKALQAALQAVRSAKKPSSKGNRGRAPNLFKAPPKPKPKGKRKRKRG